MSSVVSGPPALLQAARLKLSRAATSAQWGRLAGNGSHRSFLAPGQFARLASGRFKRDSGFRSELSAWLRASRAKPLGHPNVNGSAAEPWRRSTSRPRRSSADFSLSSSAAARPPAIRRPRPRRLAAGRGGGRPARPDRRCLVGGGTTDHPLHHAQLGHRALPQHQIDPGQDVQPDAGSAPPARPSTFSSSHRAEAIARFRQLCGFGMRGQFSPTISRQRATSGPVPAPNRSSRALIRPCSGRPPPAGQDAGCSACA